MKEVEDEVQVVEEIGEGCGGKGVKRRRRDRVWREGVEV